VKLEVGDLVEWRKNSIAGPLECIGFVRDVIHTVDSKTDHYVKISIISDNFKETTWLSADDCCVLSKVKKGE
tara:strand:- start:1027 stop:1242 length:216 start_codon:yes stop_codon:yes gene_type:complete